MYFMWLDWRGSNPLWAFIYKSFDFLWASWQKEYFTFIFLCWSISSLFSSETHFFPLLWHFTSFYRDFLCFYHLFLSFYWFIDLFLFILRGVFIYYSLFYTVIIKSFHICTDACGVWQRQEVNWLLICRNVMVSNCSADGSIQMFYSDKTDGCQN